MDSPSPRETLPSPNSAKKSRSGPRHERRTERGPNHEPAAATHPRKIFPRSSAPAHEFLHNDNPSYRYVFGFRKKGSTDPIYKNADRFKRLPVSKSIDWAIRTLTGIDELERRHCYVPLPNNPSGYSRWGGVDFDAHREGELARASDLAIRAFLHVVNEPFFTVLETSGVGFKLWMIANEFRAVSWWATFLEGIVSAIGARPQSGVIELFPSCDPKKYGRGLRAFGTWNPRNDELGGILFDDLDRLLSSLEPFAAASAEERSYLSSRETPPSFISRETGKERFAIREPATRHIQLLGMAGFLIVRCSYGVALEFANWQFNTKTVETNADLSEHLADFESIWAWSLSEWRGTLNKWEAIKFEGLTIDTDRDAFRIFRDFHRVASHSSCGEFPISRDSLAGRLAVTGPGAGKLRFRFCKGEIIQRVRPCIPNQWCAYYRWIAADEPKRRRQYTMLPPSQWKGDPGDARLGRRH
jgi:hypothetical protein